MSVEHHAFYGYGYIVNPNEVAEEEYDEYLESDFHYCINSWSNSEEEFFGICLKKVDEGEYYCIPVRDSFAPADFQKMVTEFKHFFPNRKASEIRHYMLNTVD